MTPPRAIAGPIDIGKVAAPPLIRLPDPNVVFTRRADRLARLANCSAIADFLSFMASLAGAQSAALETLTADIPSQAFPRQGMTPRDRARWRPCRSWQRALAVILDRLRTTPLTEETRAALECLMGQDADALDALAEKAVHFASSEAETAQACLAFAALQVCWTHQASLFIPGGVRLPEGGAACPVCGSPPVSSIVYAAGSLAGVRFLVCSLCATEWHLVRIKCANCNSTKGIAYLEIEGGDGLVKAETCDECRTYTKIVYIEKDPHAEVVADDLATLRLDIMVDEAGWRRATPNPFLLPGGG
jgi:FdhE protein